jgi:hypothetical protein
MSRYILIRRLRGPAILLLIGVLALLHQLGVIDHFWHYLVPLMLILLGVLLLAERAVLATDGGLAQGYPAAPYPGAPGAQPPASESTSIVPTHSHDFGDDSNGGQQ